MTPDELLSELRDIAIVWHEHDSAKVYIDGVAWNFWCNLEIVEKNDHTIRLNDVSGDDINSLRVAIRNLLQVQPDFDCRFVNELVLNEAT